jgi:phosphoribosylformylglycinamidine synthase
MIMLLKFYRHTGLVPLTEQMREAMTTIGITDVPRQELCYHVKVNDRLTVEEQQRLEWLLRQTFEPQNFSDHSFLSHMPTIAEIGPRLNFETAYSSTAVSICHHRLGVAKVVRLELSRRFGIDQKLTRQQLERFLAPIHDQMTEMPYFLPLENFGVDTRAEPVEILDVLSKNWRENLVGFAKKRGLAWDDQDLEFIRGWYQDLLKRNAPDAELFDLGQNNSDHSRHWRFNGIWYIDDTGQPETLMKMIKQPLRLNPFNSTRAFCDNTSSILGPVALVLMPSNPLGPSELHYVPRRRHSTCTAETHCHPSMWEPNQGKATEKGINRDEECIGIGGEYGVGGDGLMIGNCCLPDYLMPWEREVWTPALPIATPLQIALRGTSGGDDYQNSYGHPTTYGFFRTLGISIGNHRFEYFKPIAYGVVGGWVDEEHLEKEEVEAGQVLALIGGPARRIGVGGGSGASMTGGENDSKLDFNSVQRGDPVMGNLLHRVVRGCTELLEHNPIRTIHDLGAGGLGNTASEVVEKKGGHLYISKIPVADPTLTTFEILSNESQERDLAVVDQDDVPIIDAIATREGCPIAYIGEVTNTGRFVLEDDRDGTTPVDLPLKETLGELPPKTYRDHHVVLPLQPLQLPEGLTLQTALDRVFRLHSVASKNWRTKAVDRAVTGLVAQQQCVGPNHLPVADYTIAAASYRGLTGSVYSLGERPLPGLISPQAMVRLVITEAILNMAGARIEGLSHVKGSANWMLALKIPGMGAWLNDAMQAVRDFFIALTCAPDGGKDSTSLATLVRSPEGEVINVPGAPTFVFAAYASMKDITRKVTPYIRDPETLLLHIDLGQRKCRMGGSALAQVYEQVGNESPDMDNPDLLRRTFRAIQSLLDRRLITAAHDRSDGGLITTLFEMGAASNLGVEIGIDSDEDVIPTFLNEEPGIVLGCARRHIKSVSQLLVDEGLTIKHVGQTRTDSRFKIHQAGQEVFNQDILEMRALWEETSYQMDKRKRNPKCVEEERNNLVYLVKRPPYRLSFLPKRTVIRRIKPKVAVVREEGSNGDREMAAVAKMSGFCVVDVHMNDLQAGKITLDRFRGLLFVGGFAHRDIPESAAKGWAAGILFNLRDQFEQFRNRPDTFSLGICNGAQLSTLLGWVADLGLPEQKRPRFIQNRCWQFESGFPTVRVLKSPAIMLSEMEGSTLGIWLDHGEGYCRADENVLDEIDRLGLAPLRYMDHDGQITESYPFSRNGSPRGIAALCSRDGRHLAMMPHSERTFIPWQWPWMPDGWNKHKVSPWLQMFQTARNWCLENN